MILSHLKAPTLNISHEVMFFYENIHTQKNILYMHLSSLTLPL